MVRVYTNDDIRVAFDRQNTDSTCWRQRRGYQVDSLGLVDLSSVDVVGQHITLLYFWCMPVLELDQSYLKVSRTLHL